MSGVVARADEQPSGCELHARGSRPALKSAGRRGWGGV